MKIGIIGGPEAGKSKLAKAIHEELGYTIIDEYVDRLSKRVDSAFGPYATHLGNAQVAIERLNCELEAGGDNFVTCGTLIETMAYDALYGIKTIDDQRTERARISTTMDFLGMMMIDTYLYDRLYHLESTDEGLEFQINYAIRLFSLRPMKITDNYNDAIDDIKNWEKMIDELKSSETDE